MKFPVETMSRLKIEFDQPKQGWLKMELRSEQVVLSDAFSHMLPTLANLCDALCALAAGKGSRPVVFLLEPQELELSFTMQENQNCSVRAVRFPDRHRGTENEIVFAYSGPSREVVLSFWRALRQLQTGLSEHEFTKRWREPFPATEMAALTAAVEWIKNMAAVSETKPQIDG